MTTFQARNQQRRVNREKSQTNWGSGYNQWGQQRAPSGVMSQGSLPHGTPPSGSRFQPPNAGVSANFGGGPQGLLINNATPGIITNTMGALVQSFDRFNAQKRINAVQANRQATAQAKVTQQGNTFQQQLTNAFNAVNPTSPQNSNPLMQAWNNSPNNPKQPNLPQPLIQGPALPYNPPSGNAQGPVNPHAMPSGVPQGPPAPILPYGGIQRTSNLLDFSKPYAPPTMGLQPDQEEKNIFTNLTRPITSAPKSRTQNRQPKNPIEPH